MFQKFFSPCISQSSESRHAIPKSDKKIPQERSSGVKNSNPDLIQHINHVSEAKHYSAEQREHEYVSQYPKTGEWANRSGNTSGQRDSYQPMSTFKANAAPPPAQSQYRPVNVYNHNTPDTQRNSHLARNDTEITKSPSPYSQNLIVQQHNQEKNREYFSSASKTNPGTSSQTYEEIPQRVNEPFTTKVRESKGLVAQAGLPEQTRKHPKEVKESLHSDVRSYSTIPRYHSISSSYQNLTKVEERVPYYRSNSDSNILEDFRPVRPPNNYPVIRQRRQTPRSIKRKKRRRKTYSSVEDMLDWDMHTDTSDVDIFSQDEDEKSKNKLIHKTAALNISTSFDGDSSVFEDIDVNSKISRRRNTRNRQEYSGYSSGFDSSTSYDTRFREYDPPYRNSRLHFDIPMTADSVFSVRDIVSPTDRFCHFEDENGGRSRMYRNKSDSCFDHSYRLNSSQSFVQKYVQSHDLSDILLDREDVRVINRLCVGINFAVCSACLKSRNVHNSPYFAHVCVQSFQGLDNNADRINFLQNAAELRQLQHRHILQVIGVCISSKKRAASEMILVTECTHYLVNLQRLLGWCDENHPQLFTEECLVIFALEVCWGLSYLESQGIIHNNLTTSTIMIDTSCVIKLSGLEPHGIKQRCAPYRWVSKESHKGVFTSAGTMWSLGIVLWAMKTLGDKPYSHLKTAGEIYNYLNQGKRLDRPSNCSDILYDWMCACWRLNPHDRPQLEHIMRFLSSYKKRLPHGKRPSELFPNQKDFWLFFKDH